MPVPHAPKPSAAPELIVNRLLPSTVKTNALLWALSSASLNQIAPQPASLNTCALLFLLFFILLSLIPFFFLSYLVNFCNNNYHDFRPE